MPKSPKIQWTSDYGRFDVHVCNRPERHRRDLLESMKDNGFIADEAITCVPNGGTRLQIRKGHHRFICARKLGIPLAFKIVDPNIDFARLERTQKPYSSKEWVHTWDSVGIPSYGVLLQYRERYKLPLSISAALIAGCSTSSGLVTNRVKDGTFEATSDMSHAYAVGAITDVCANLGFPFARKTNFVQAVSLALMVLGVTSERLRKKIQKYPGRMKTCYSANEYLELLEFIYNHHANAKTVVSIKFEARKLAGQRSKDSRLKNRAPQHQA